MIGVEDSTDLKGLVAILASKRCLLARLGYPSAYVGTTVADEPAVLTLDRMEARYLHDRRILA